MMRTQRRPSAAAVKASAAFQAPDQSLLLARKQFAMAQELRITLPVVSTPTSRMEALRRWIVETHIADHKVRPSHTETWAQAFERVHGEPLE